MDEHPPLHDALRPLEPLLGTWRGQGTGRYPRIDDFEYGEEVRFWHYGRPVLAYSQRTWSPAGVPMHSEMGYWRPAGEGRLEVVLAHSFGVTEIQEGRMDAGRIELRSKALTSATTANEVRAVSRTFEVTGDTITYDLHMAFGGHDLQPHLEGRLQRVRA